MNVDGTDPAQSQRLRERQFEHQELQVPAEQIRLIEISPQRPGVPLELHLSIHSVANLPRYHAISYTWGDCEDPVTVLVNDQPMSVTKNCHYALVQIQPHYSRPYHENEVRDFSERIYIWIDSICIDQNNTVEKGPQVAMMGHTFATASKVLACVGPHQDHSEELAVLLHSVRENDPQLYSGRHQLDNHLGFNPWGHPILERIKRFIHSYAKTFEMSWDEFQLHIRRAFLDFANRRYWTRVWIIQEVASSFGPDGGQPELLCGRDVFTRSEINLLFHIVAYLHLKGHHHYIGDGQLFDVQSHHCFKIVMTMDPSSPIRAALLFEYIDQSHQCSKPEDRVYGLLSLIEWPDGALPIQPVYNSSAAFDLAELFLSLQTDAAAIKEILEGLEICHDSIQMKQLSRARYEQPRAHKDSCSKYLSSSYKLPSCQCRVISRNSANQLTACLDRSRKSNPISKEIANRGALNIEDVSSSDHTPQFLYSGSAVGALLCGGAREDDLIIKTGFAQHLLIIRRTDQIDNYDIIGQGTLLSGHDLRSGKYRKRFHVLKRMAELEEKELQESGADSENLVSYQHFSTALRRALKRPAPARSGFESDLALMLTPIDMLLLGGQDLEKDGTRNARESLRRLRTTIYGTVMLDIDVPRDT
ncbi:heterokaryon incompatibility protein-domain-containing protein [Pestalotiopsis sp. NC0098]|nr:heterokaryon incompatibility protein-domain-containing protein [Pestalotiopsis sp. NC0098]